jgi:outer membrane immunogenic protein
MFGRIALASVSVIALAAAAEAADMYVPAPEGLGGYKDAPAVSDWSGFYIGINGGGGWGNTDFPFGFSAPVLGQLAKTPAQRSSGGLAGGQLGYNWQYGRFVGGLEVDFDAVGIKSASNLGFVPPPSVINHAVNIDELASIRGRLGWTVRPDLLAYGTAGLGFGHSKNSFAETTAGTLYTSNIAGAAEFGWVAGAGLEYKLLDHWLLRADYLHYDFGSQTSMLLFSQVGTNIDANRSHTTADIVRGGLSYKFGPEGTADSGLKDTAYVSDWAGFYVGVNGGGGWGHSDFPLNSYFPAALGGTILPPTLSSSGGLAGGHSGYNWQYGRAVAGLEADFDAADIKGSANVPVAPNTFSHELKIDQLASVRGRVGWTVWPDLLAYGTGGIALGHFQASALNTFFPASPGFYQYTGAGGAEFGWVAGAGLEYKINDNLLLRGEYLHYDFGMVINVNLASVPPSSFVDAGNARTAIDVVRAGLSYRFGPGGGAAAPSLKDSAYVSDWSGLYAGINGGGGWAPTDFPFGYALPAFYGQIPGDPTLRSSGGLFGGQLGYNWQYGRAIAGLEADFDAADIKSTSNLAVPPPSFISQTVKTDELASVRARFGWVAWPELLAYGTGGLGLGHFRYSIANPQYAQTNGTTEFGWVAGAGFEYKLLEHVLLRAEYLHYGFGTVNQDIGQPIDAQISRTTVDTVRGGVSYKF